jgi:capsular polysaccharide biosynthesis protein
MADQSRNTERRSPRYAESLDLGHLIQAVLRQFWVVVMTVVVLTGATAGFSIVQTPEYVAQTMIIIGQEGKLTQDPVEEAGLQSLTDTMVVAIDTRPVAEGVIRKLELQRTTKEVLDNMSAQRLGATQFIEVSYSDTDPKRAHLVANTIGTVFSDKIAVVSPGPHAITASIWEPAAVPGSPVSPDPIRNGFLALVLGLMLGVGLAVLVDFLSVRGRHQKM